MPASMISAETGSKLNVIGSRSAIVAVGPMPGSTPTAVPSTTPMKQYSRFSRRRAVSSPSARFSNSSIARSERDPRADQRQPQLQGDHEDQQRENRQTDGDDQRLAPRRRGARQRREQGRPEQR